LPAEGRLDVSEQVCYRLNPAFYIPAEEYLHRMPFNQFISVSKWIAADPAGAGVLRSLILGSFEYYETVFESGIRHLFLCFSLLFCDGLLLHAKSPTIFVPIALLQWGKPELEDDKEENTVLIFRPFIDALICRRQRKIREEFTTLVTIHV
jgi:hypothetical protein